MRLVAASFRRSSTRRSILWGTAPAEPGSGSWQLKAIAGMGEAWRRDAFPMHIGVVANPGGEVAGKVAFNCQLVAVRQEFT